MKTKSIIFGLLLVGLLICLSVNVSANQPSSLSLNDLKTLRTKHDYTPIGYKSIVGDMGATVFDSISSSFSSAFTSSSNAVGNIMMGKSWIDHGTLFNKIIRGTATMNELANNPFTMQFSVSLPLLNTKKEHYGLTLNELSNAFGVPGGSKYYDYIGRKNGISRFNYNQNNLFDISKIDWKIPKLEFPIVDFKKFTSPQIKSPTLKPMSMETSSYSSPSYYNYNYHTINTPKITMPRMNNNIYSPGFSSSRNYYSSPSFRSFY